MFTINLVVSKNEVHSKDQGKTVVEYKPKEFASDKEDELERILRTRNYSTNVWNGSRHSKNYVGMTGVALDIDGGMTIDEAKTRFAQYKYIIHTSSSHQVDKNGIIADRFRVILPFSPEPLRFTTPAECKKVYTKLLYEYPEMDPACTDAGRQFFPFTEDNGASFEFHINESGDYFDIDISDISDEEVASDYEPKDWDGNLRPKAELERILKFCPFVKWMDENIDNPKTEMHEPLRFALVSNLCSYEGGPEEIHRILSRDCRPGKYSVGLIDDKIDRNQQFYNPQTYRTISKLGWPGKIPSKPLSPAGWAKIGTKKRNENVFLGWKDNLIVSQDGKWQVTNLIQLKENLSQDSPAICPVCDSDQAMLKQDIYNFLYIRCPNCAKDYYESALQPGIFTYKNKFLRVEKRAEKFISMEVLESTHFRTRNDFQFAKTKVFNDPNRKFLDNNFQVRRIGNAMYDHLDYELDIENNALVYKFPALLPRINDNAFIDTFLNGLFGQYANFIKNWLAMYCYTNYIKLPVLVLTGPRGCGKNTFGEMVSKIFPSLAGLWNGDSTHFNEQYTKKLLFVDENPNADKVTQYTEIKKITGNDKNKINEKYQPEYYAPNNINIIIATNDHRPLFVKWQEEPQSPKNNNFFIFECPAVNPSKIDSKLACKLEERLGHYVRTELQDRYLELMKNDRTNSRYGIDAPITQFAKDLYSSAKTSIEEEAEELAEYIVRGVKTIKNYDDKAPKSTEVTYIKGPRIDFMPTVDQDGDHYILPRDIRRLVKLLEYSSKKTNNSYVEALVRAGVISMRNNHREDKRRLGHRILKKADEYEEQDVITLYRY